MEHDLDTVAALDVAGVSLYSLMLHEKTPLYRRLDQEAKTEMGNLHREKELFDHIFDGLTRRGYRMLELTKMVKDGRDRYDYMEIRHSGGSCIALGHGAGGNIENYFYHNAYTVPYISEATRVCSRGRVLLPEYRVLDALVYALQKGNVKLGPYAEQLGVDLLSLLAEPLTKFVNSGYLTVEGDRVTLTREGLFFGNNIISELINRISDSPE